MINPLKVATAGYLKRQVKAVLIISVAGYLNFSAVSLQGGSVHDYSVNKQTIENRIKKNEEEWMLFIKIYVEQCQ